MKGVTHLGHAASPVQVASAILGTFTTDGDIATLDVEKATREWLLREWLLVRSVSRLIGLAWRWPLGLA